MGPHAWRRRPAKRVCAARCAFIIAARECTQRICSMAGPIMKGVFAPILQFVIILTTVLTKCFNASFTATGINPGPSEHAASKIDAIKNIGLRNGNRFNTQRRQRLHTRPATAELPYFDVVWEIVIPVLPAVLQSLVVQHAWFAFHRRRRRP